MYIITFCQALLGGNVRFAITGGAPLSPETHDFIRVCLGLTLVQGTQFVLATFLDTLSIVDLFSSFHSSILLMVLTIRGIRTRFPKKSRCYSKFIDITTYPVMIRR